ncbi:pathogenesis-related protein 1-like [Senna tora]|uniref:Pathogenesis-related protein 1-like n=1 Tax=Senna tora TaxID=362788 RepID=A0A835CJ16_9FABA|nr:pathogenesis-related protein 1-like [Senna tora]
MASWSSSSCINNVVCFCLLVKVVVVVEAALIEEFLKAHNAARLEVGVPPIEWDNTVAQYAQEYANTRKAECKPEHSGGPYGENLVWSSGDMSAADAVAMWVKEKAFYDYPNNRCMDGQQCLHYTQAYSQVEVKAKTQHKTTWMAITQQEQRWGVPNLAWDNTVAAFAHNYANQRKEDCQLVHSGGAYGENLAGSTGDLSGADAVRLWVEEKPIDNTIPLPVDIVDSDTEDETTPQDKGGCGSSSKGIQNQHIQDSEPLGRGHRHKEVPSRLKDYVIHTITHTSPSVLTPTSQHTSALTVEREPLCYSHAVKDHRWREAMRREIEALETNKTWEKANYNYENNSCEGGECLHYTQVVWSTSVRLGCAKVTCTTEAPSLPATMILLATF